MFQSTHLHEVWRYRNVTIQHKHRFNPHTYMRCDSNSRHNFTIFGVSIHTPTWGVTPLRSRHSIKQTVSIHTPTWGVTIYSWRDDYVFHVSIHTPTWGVTTYSPTASRISSVSIHTPTWGVTIHFQQSFSCKQCFNPHTYMRCDT